MARNSSHSARDKSHSGDQNRKRNQLHWHGGGDTSPEGKVSTGLGVLGFIPGVGTAASALSVGFDVFRTAKEVRNCP